MYHCTNVIVILSWSSFFAKIFSSRFFIILCCICEHDTQIILFHLKSGQTDPTQLMISNLFLHPLAKFPKHSLSVAFEFSINIVSSASCILLNVHPAIINPVQFIKCISLQKLIKEALLYFIECHFVIHNVNHKVFKYRRPMKNEMTNDMLT